MQKRPQVKKITAGLILSWVFGVLFLLVGVSVIGSGAYILGIIIVLCSAMIIPYFNHLISEKFHIEISGGVKFLLVIVIFIAIGFSMASITKNVSRSTSVDLTKVDTIIGQDSTVDQEQVQTTPSAPALNKKTEYIKNSLRLEDVEVGQGYGQFDVPGFSPKKPIVRGKIRNIGNQTLDIVEITIYFLDSSGTRIGEKQYYPVDIYSFFGDKAPLKPNYVRDWGYVIDDAPSGWAKKVEVVISDITFREE